MLLKQDMLASVCGSGGHGGGIDTLLPYVQSGCSASAGRGHKLPPKSSLKVSRAGPL